MYKPEVFLLQSIVLFIRAILLRSRAILSNPRDVHRELHTPGPAGLGLDQVSLASTQAWRTAA
jgi:hypothetical protein